MDLSFSSFSFDVPEATSQSKIENERIDEDSEPGVGRYSSRILFKTTFKAPQERKPEGELG